MYNVSFSLVYKVDIPDETIFQVLSEINGVAPTHWFIAKNVGKDRKDTFAYIVNNAPEYIQLIPLKGDKKQGVIDRGNIITLNKSTDIDKCVFIITDYCKIKITLKNGAKLLLIAHFFGSTKHQINSIKVLRREYKKQSRPAQAFWNTLLVIYVILVVLIGWQLGEKIGENIVENMRDTQQQQEQSQEEQEAIKEIEREFETNVQLINSPGYKEVFSVKLQPYESDAVVTGNTKVVELDSFRFTVSANSQFNKFDSGDYAYVDGSDNKILGVGYVDTYTTIDEVAELKNTTYKHIKGGTLEKMGYSMNSHYDMLRSELTLDYFSKDVENFNYHEKLLFNLAVKNRMREATEQTLLLAAYEKEFDSYYMIVKKIQHNDMAEVPVYAYQIDIYFKDDLNTFQSYAVTSMGYTEEECFAIINSMELIEE